MNIRIDSKGNAVITLAKRERDTLNAASGIARRINRNAPNSTIEDTAARAAGAVDELFLALADDEHERELAKKEPAQAGK